MKAAGTTSSLTLWREACEVAHGLGTLVAGRWLHSPSLKEEADDDEEHQGIDEPAPAPKEATDPRASTRLCCRPPSLDIGTLPLLLAAVLAEERHANLSHGIIVDVGLSMGVGV